MRGSKEAVWAVVISAALVTAGLILSCGDDDGGAAFSCQDACEKLQECEWIPDDIIIKGIISFFGPTVGACVEACEDELAGSKWGFTEFFECVTNSDCEELEADCFCQPYCEKLDDCFLSDWETVDDCIVACEEVIFMYITPIICTIGFSSCNLIEEHCMMLLP